jgi:hypothetical protein
MSDTAVYSDATARSSQRLKDAAGGRQDNNPDEDRRTGVVGEDDDEFLSVLTLKNQLLDYLSAKIEEIEEQKDSRRYYHGAQLDHKQRKTLEGRHQPVQIWNRIGRKINGIVGQVERMRCDPKAVGRNPKSEQGAEIATQSIRYVCDSNQFKDTIEPAVMLQSGIESIAGVQIVMQKGDKGDPDVGIHKVVGDEYFYDPRSYDFNFKDVRYEGIMKWMDVEAAAELFPNKSDELEGLFQGDSDLTTNPDREVKWLILAQRRVRMIEHWYRHKGKWRWAFYCANVLLDQGVSPFSNDRGESESSFVMFSAAVDQDGDRYSFVRNFKGPQDALNQGKSKGLALANSRRIKAEKGAVDDVEIARREAARHDGYLEINPGKIFEVEDTTKDVAVFAAFTDDAKKELDGFANADLAAMGGPGGITNISGKAIELLRQPGMAELAPFVLSHRSWKLDLYRRIWNAVQRHWTAERWIRVNTDDKLAQFIQLNGLSVDQFGRPAIVNHVGALDVNIVLDQGPDISTIMEDISDKLTKYPPGTFPPQVLIEMDPNLSRSDKDRYLQILAPKPPPPDPIAEAVKRLHVEGLAGKNAKTAAETQKTLASADQAMATAEEKRANVGNVGHDQHMDAAEFVRDTLFEQHKIMAPFLQAQQGGQQGGAQGPQPKPQEQPQQPQPLIPGIRRARDGKHYVSDPHRPGKYLQLVHR